jgi:hypothetical protein
MTNSPHHEAADSCWFDPAQSRCLRHPTLGQAEKLRLAAAIASRPAPWIAELVALKHAIRTVEGYRPPANPETGE